MKKSLALVVAFVAVLAFATSANAQANSQPQQDKSSWGVGVDVTPQWEYMSVMDRFIGSDHKLEGQEFRVGIVHGRIRGGDWGVSVVRGKVNSSSFHKERTGESGRCQGPPSAMVCTTKVTEVENYVGAASLIGFEVHKYVPFVTVADRVQIGVNFGGGAMVARGTAEKHTIETLAISQRTIDTWTTPFRADEIVSQSRTVEAVLFKDVSKDVLGFTTIPTGRIEAIVGVIVTEHLKIKVSGGLNFPTQHRFAIGATYLF